MKKGSPGPMKVVSGIVMILALLWLSVSTPFVYEASQLAKAEISNTNNGEDNNPFSNTTEEKNESSTSTISEYIHELLHAERPFTVVVKYFKCHSAEVYFAYHPELISPPPEA